VLYADADADADADGCRPWISRLDGERLTFADAEIKLVATVGVDGVSFPSAPAASDEACCDRFEIIEAPRRTTK
jgi:hypothetical protein